MSQDGLYYRITFTTPNIAFAPDPATGRTGEQEFHQGARRRFVALLAKFKPQIERNVGRLRAELEGGPALVPYSEAHPQVWDHQLGKPGGPAGPCRMEFVVGYPEPGSLALAFGRAPARQEAEALRERIRALFSDVAMGPSQRGEHYRLTLDTSVDFSLDPATGRTVAPALERLRPLIEKRVAALVAESGQEVALAPYDDADPLSYRCADEPGGPPEARGRSRMGIQVPGEGGAPSTLYLSFGNPPTRARFTALARLAGRLFSAGEEVADTRWSVEGPPVLWLFRSRSERWVFHLDGVVEADGLWKGRWERQGERYLVDRGEQGGFFVEFAADGRSFTALAGSSVYRTGARLE